MPRTSLSALEILARQTREDADLDRYPLVRANLLTFIRSLQRQGLEQGEQDIAIGRVLNRRHLLLLVPSGALKTAEAMNLAVRIEEQNHKANSALRRRARKAGGLWLQPGRRMAPPMRGFTRQEQGEAGDVPAGVEDDAAEAAGGGE